MIFIFLDRDVMSLNPLLLFIILKKSDISQQLKYMFFLEVKRLKFDPIFY